MRYLTGEQSLRKVTSPLTSWTSSREAALVVARQDKAVGTDCGIGSIGHVYFEQ